MRVNQCCCGCSLKTGTLILLWLDLLNQASNVIKLSVAICSSPARVTFLDSALLGWSSLCLVIIIYGIVGVDKHRPSYLLPYVGIYVVSLVSLALFTVILWVGSLAMRDYIIETLSSRVHMTSSKGHELTPEEIRASYDAMVTIMTVLLVICFAVVFYFYAVVYSYYKQMQEEDKGIYNPPSGTGIVYSAPAAQPKSYDSPPAYGQQPGVAPYPQQNTGYPQPAAGYPQPVAGYPNLPQNAAYPQQQYPNYPEKQ